MADVRSQSEAVLAILHHMRGRPKYKFVDMESFSLFEPIAPKNAGRPEIQRDGSVHWGSNLDSRRTYQLWIGQKLRSEPLALARARVDVDRRSRLMITYEQGENVTVVAQQKKDGKSRGKAAAVRYSLNWGVVIGFLAQKTTFEVQPKQGAVDSESEEDEEGEKDEEGEEDKEGEKDEEGEEDNNSPVPSRSEQEDDELRPSPAKRPFRAESRRLAGSQPAGSQPAGSQPAGSQPAGSQPAGSQPAGSQPAGPSRSDQEEDELRPSPAKRPSLWRRGLQRETSPRPKEIRGESSGNIVGPGTELFLASGLSEPAGSQQAGSQPAGSQPAGSQPVLLSSAQVMDVMSSVGRVVKEVMSAQNQEAESLRAALATKEAEVANLRQRLEQKGDELEGSADLRQRLEQELDEL
jgi:hypothetical protein